MMQTSPPWPYRWAMLFGVWLVCTCFGRTTFYNPSNMEPKMRLYLVQHGEAIPKDVDPERPLSDKGRSDIASLGAWLHRHGIEVSEILHSEKTRAQQTAEILKSLLGSGGHVRQDSGLGPEDSPKLLLRRFREQEKDILIVSHLPLVARVVSVATTGGAYRQVVEFQPGSVAGLVRMDGRSWRLFLFARPEVFANST
jgi:phosphohistidine phosphatase